MSEDSLSRRSFLKLSRLVFASSVLTACGIKVKNPEGFNVVLFGINFCGNTTL